MIAVGLVYSGFLVALIGLISLAKPLPVVRIRRRRQAAAVLMVGIFLVAGGVVVPALETTIVTPQTLLDQFAPVFQFHEVHAVRIAASRERVYAAIKAVTSDEILFFRTLTWIRRLGRATPEGILNAPGQQPILDVATRTSFFLLTDEPGREIVLGTAVAAPSGWRPKANPTPEDFKTVHAPGFVLAALNFRIAATDPATCVVTTETRVYATDAAGRRMFAPYWRVIYPGSALIRRMWLRAIKARAEATPTRSVSR
jgi:hypothetical protein